MSRPDRGASPLGRWAGPVALALVALALAGIVAIGEASRTARPTDSLPEGLDSTLGVELREGLPQSDAVAAVVVFEATEGEESLRASLGGLEERARALGAAGPLLPAEDGTAAVAVVSLEGGSATDVAEQVERLRDRVRDDLPDGVDALVTGPAAIQADLAEVFQGADTRLLMITAAVVAVLLVITYRSPVLWLVPLVVVALADRFAAVAATQVLDALGMAWDESTIGILSVLVFGAGTDYALLLISRYRDELGRTSSRSGAMAVARSSTAHAVLASSVTVVLGVLTLLLSLTPSTRGLGMACAVGIVVAAAFALLVLPPALVLFGRWVFWPRIPREGTATLAERDSLWRRLGALVARRATGVAAASVVGLALLSVGALGIQTGLDVDDQFLDEPEAVVGAERIAQSFPAGVATPTQVLTRARAEEALARVEDVDAVASARVSAEGGGVAEISVVFDADPGSDAARTAVDDLRASLDGLDDTHVVGEEAEAVDEAEAASRDRRVILPVILLVVLVALFVLLRALLAPLVLVVTVVATYTASMGASWWLFTGPLGFDALDAGAPLLAFLFLVALGVDYNIFLVSRAMEELRAHGSRGAVLQALAATGGVITSAGILLAAVFLVLGVLPLVVLAQLGVIICIGVLLDTLVVRTVLVPAIAIRLGDAFWWPRRVTTAD